MRLGHHLDHRADRRRLADTAPGVVGREPVEAAKRIILLLLLGVEQGEAMAVGEPGPAGTLIVAGGGLGAAVQDDDQRRARAEAVRHVAEAAEVARIVAGRGQIGQPAVPVRGRSKGDRAAHGLEAGKGFGKAHEQFLRWA
jgi:hypothetical protein